MNILKGYSFAVILAVFIGVFLSVVSFIIAPGPVKQESVDALATKYAECQSSQIECLAALKVYTDTYKLERELKIFAEKFRAPETENTVESK